MRYYKEVLEQRPCGHHGCLREGTHRLIDAVYGQIGIFCTDHINARLARLNADDGPDAGE